MMVTDGEGTPLAAHIESASPAEVKLIETTLDKIAVGNPNVAGRPRSKPKRFIADKAYDSNRLRQGSPSAGFNQ